jgi:hypothetical protein
MMANENGFRINWLWSEKGRNLAGTKAIVVGCDKRVQKAKEIIEATLNEGD